MKKSKNIFLCIICVFTVISEKPINATSFDSNKNYFIQNKENLTKKFNQNIKNEYIKTEDVIFYENEMKLLDGFDDKKINNIKTIKGFDDSLYVVVECLPTGYLIYEKQFNILLECGPYSKSSYLDYDTNLYYGGPTNYFKSEKNLNANYSNYEIENLINHKSTNISRLEVDKLKSKSVELTNKIAMNKKQISNYSTYSSTRSGDYVSSYIDNYEYITKIKSFGENKNGTCGYIAAGLILYYAYKQYNTKFINQKYITSDGFSDNLHKYLVDLGKSLFLSNGTVAADIEKLMKEYTKERVPEATHYSMTLSTEANIDLCIKDNKPMILFGHFENVSTQDNPWDHTNHAIVAFGKAYRSVSLLVREKYLYVHYGWPGYSHIMIQDSIFKNPIGSFYNMNPRG